MLFGLGFYRQGLPSWPLPARCTEQLRGKGRRWGCGLDAVAQVQGRRWLVPQVRTIVAPGSACESYCPQPIFSAQQHQAHQGIRGAHTRPTHPSSPANSPIKIYYYRTHILPSLNHLPLHEQEFLFAKAGNTSPLRNLAQKPRSPAKKGRGVRK